MRPLIGTSIDHAIFPCYAWRQLEVARGAYPNDHAQTYYTVSPAARRELLRSLAKLNSLLASEVDR